MAGLSIRGSEDPTWYPVSINDFDELLKKVIYSGRGYRHTYALRRNIAYNLQHLEFLDRCLCDLKLSSVLTTQTWKTFIIVGCGIVESLLHFLLISRNAHAETEWKLDHVLPGNTKKVAGRYVKAEVHVFEKLASPVRRQMTFDAMLKRAEARKLLGSDDAIYAALHQLRPLRNRIHLQQIEGSADHDWNAFEVAEMSVMAEVIHEVFTSSIFRPSAEQREYFTYLKRHFGSEATEA